MVLRFVIFIVLILGVVGIGAVTYFALTPPAPAPVTADAPAAVAPPPPVEQSHAIVTPVHTLRAGTLIKADDLVAKTLPIANIPPNAVLDTPAVRADLLGAVVRRTIQADDPILPDQFMRVGDHGFLAAVLRPGMRAVSVGVDPVAGLAGLVWPGDYVDLILTQQSDDPAATSGHRVAGETVLHSLRVIAVDQDLVQGGSGTSGPGTGGAQASRTVTLEVSPADAQRVAIASRLGRLTLAIVAVDETGVTDEVAAAAPAPTPDKADDGKVDVTKIKKVNGTPGNKSPVLWGNDVSAALDDDSKKTAGPGLRIYDGTTDGKEVHFQ